MLKLLPLTIFSLFLYRNLRLFQNFQISELFKILFCSFCSTRQNMSSYTNIYYLRWLNMKGKPKKIIKMRAPLRETSKLFQQIITTTEFIPNLEPRSRARLSLIFHVIRQCHKNPLFLNCHDFLKKNCFLLPSPLFWIQISFLLNWLLSSARETSLNIPCKNVLFAFQLFST